MHNDQFMFPKTTEATADRLASMRVVYALSEKAVHDKPNDLNVWNNGHFPFPSRSIPLYG